MPAKKYKHIFFDLDRTLWDFERNSKKALEKLFQQYQLEKKIGLGFEEFLKAYRIENEKLWEAYRRGKIEKDHLRKKRFYLTFKKFGLDDPEFSLNFNNQYVSLSSQQKGLVEGADEILNFLVSRYQLHIITNGFREAQNAKLDGCGLRSFFKQIVISDGLGFRKPQAEIFHYALNLAGAEADESLMIGDDYGPDVLGAKSVGMDQVYLEWIKVENNRANFTIHHLLELKEIL